MTTSSTMIPSDASGDRSELRKGAAHMVVGVLSDTHGHLYPKVRESLTGVDHIIHAGDIGSPRVLEELRRLAPVTAVRGNCDLEAWAAGLQSRAEVEFEGVPVVVGHIAGHIGERARAPHHRHESRFAVVISGHTHVAAVERRDGTLYLNPGSAGPSRFGRPRTVARLTIVSDPGAGPHLDARVQAEIVVVEE